MASGVTWTRSTTIKTGLGSLGGKAESLTKTKEINVKVDLTASQANKQVIFPVPTAKVHGWAIDFVKAADETATGSPTTITVKSNSATTPDDSAVIKYGSAFGWIDGLDPDANQPFAAADVANLYITNGAAIGVTVLISVLMDEV